MFAEMLPALLLSAKVGFFSCLFSLPLAIFFAYFLEKYNFFGKILLEVLLQLPMVLPPVVVGYGLLFLFGANGFLGKFLLEYCDVVLVFNWKGAALAAGLMGFPLMVNSIRLAFANISPYFAQSAQTLGASSWRIFWQIELPLAKLGILVGMVLGFSRALGEFGATIAFVGNIPDETQTLPLAIYTAMQQINGESTAYLLMLCSLGLAFLALLLSHILQNKMRQNTRK